MEVELRLALVGLVAIATWSPSTAAAEFMCSGSRCFARESYCEEFRASRHDEGRRAPACRAARRIFCFLATETISGDDITFCSSTMAECRRDLRATQTLNRRLSVNPYSDLSECEEVEWDSDSDGVPNGVDACEHLAGAASARGCPDADGDGAANFSDHCPDIAGSVAGCPDADSDGVGDPDDACPDVAGTLITAGCPLPDGDADGVPDADDRCPAAAGTEGTDGCPDADGDHLEDSLDLCPDVAMDPRWAIVGCPDSDHDMIPDACFEVARASEMSVYAEDAALFTLLANPACPAGRFADLCPHEREDGASRPGYEARRVDGCPGGGRPGGR